MSNNNSNEIRERIDIPKSRLWVIWFLMFVLPSIIAILGYQTYIDEYMYFARTDLIYKSYENIRKYNDSIIPENFMTDRLNQIAKQNIDKDTELIKSDIDNSLCGETMFCLFFDKKLDNFKMVKNKNLANNKYKIPPIALLKNNLKKYIEADSGTVTPPLSRLQKLNINKQLGETLQQLFKTATIIPMTKGKVSKNFSVTYGGELYFLYNIFEKPSKDIYGFFAVMQGRNFNFHKMLEQQHTIFPNARIVYRDMEINKVTVDRGTFYSGISHDNETITITAPTSDKFIRHVVNSGSENLNPGYGTLFPFVEYHVPMETIYEKLIKNYNIIRLIALIIILISGIYTLHVCLFGFQDNLSFKRKILYLTLIASLFPFSVFFLGNYSFIKYERFISRTSAIQHAETELEHANQELEQYLTAIEASMNQACQKLSAELSHSPLKPSSVLNFLGEIGEQYPVSTLLLYYNNIPSELEIIAQGNKISKRFSEKTSEELIAEEDETIINIIPAVAFETINDTEETINKNRTRKDVYEIGKTQVPIPKLNNVLKNDGSLIPFDQFTMPTWYIMQMLSKAETHEIFAMLIAKFEPRPLLASFLSNSVLSRKGFKEIKNNFEINYAFLPTEKSGSAPIWSGSGNIDEVDKKFCLKNTQSERLETGENNKVIIKKNNQKVPNLAVAIITEVSDSDEQILILKLLLAIFAYLSLILYISSKLFDFMFVEPVSLLASSAGAIARGSEDWNAEINSGDEFEELNDNFKQLVTGLRERNLLKSYVSEDAFSDIKETSTLKYLPGGEYKEATIVFSAIKDYDKLISNLSPHEIIKLLSKYISIAEEVIKNYGGSIDKILGETIMLVFRDDPDQDSHGLRAAQAALEFVEKIKEAGFPGLYTGIASGTVISGRIGSYSGKLDFTVIGNPVNLAARFKAESKKGTESTGIIISGITMGLMNGRGRVKFLRRVSIKGKARKYNIYELLSIR